MIDTRSGPIAWMARNPVASNLLMVALLVGGVFALLSLKQEIFPEFELDMVTIQVPYPGASPAEVEQGIVLAIEEAVRGLDGVKYVRSTSAESMGAVTVEMLLGADPDKVTADVKSAVDRISSFPEEAERPTVSLVSRRRPVVDLVIAGEQSEATLHAIGEKARAELLASPAITQVDLVGVRALEVSIGIRQETLEAYGLSLEEVARQVGAASVEVPSGGIKTEAGEVLLRVSDRKRSVSEFASIVVRSTAGGADVRLGDIATIVDGYAETDQATYYDGKRAVRLTAYRVGDETPAGVSEAVHAYADELRAELPANISVQIWDDDSEMLTQRIDLLMRNAQFGLVLVFVVLALFLRLRLAFWVALGIPISFLGALLVLGGTTISINMITLFAFIVTLGMVVDDAIVVGENVFEMMQGGMEPLEAAIRGAKEMAVPVTFSILTTVAAFSPLFFVPGVMGKIFGLIPAVVVTVLLVSLIESFFILPAHLGHMDPNKRGRISAAVERVQNAVARGLAWFTAHPYRRTLDWAVRNRYLTLALGIALLVISLGIVAGGRVPFTFFPRLEGDVVVASARLPYGAPIERTLVVREALEKAAEEAVQASGGDGIVRGLFTRVGEVSGNETGSHLVQVELALVSSEARDVTSQEVASRWSKAMPPMAGIESLQISAGMGPGAGAPVNVQISHADNRVLAAVSAELTETLRSYPTLTDVLNGWSSGKTQLDFQLLPEARSLGLTTADVARQLRSHFFGAEAIREQRDRNELRVMVRLPEEQRRSLHDLERLLVSTPSGAKVPLSQVARFDRGRSPTSIQRENGRRIVNVSAELAHGAASAQDVLASLRADVFPGLQQKYPGLELDLVGQQREQAESFGSLGRNFLLALLGIYVLLAIPFRSYAQPLVVMSAIPFGFVGAIGGHVLLGYGLSLMSMMGMIALAGVVVNDSLVLIDAANGARAKGMEAVDAIRWAGERRLRPVLLTSLTTFVGLAPMVLETSVQARFLIPMAISLAFGVLFATAVILVLVPGLYLMIEDFRALIGLAPKDEAKVAAVGDEEAADAA